MFYKGVNFLISFFFLPLPSLAPPLSLCLRSLQGSPDRIIRQPVNWPHTYRPRLQIRQVCKDRSDSIYILWVGGYLYMYRWGIGSEVMPGVGAPKISCQQINKHPRNCDCWTNSSLKFFSWYFYRSRLCNKCYNSAVARWRAEMRLYREVWASRLPTLRFPLLKRLAWQLETVCLKRSVAKRERQQAWNDVMTKVCCKSKRQNLSNTKKLKFKCL